MLSYAFLGAWLRAGEGIGWLAAGTMSNTLYRMPLVYIFLTCVFCYSCSFLFDVFCVFVFFFLLSLELGRCSSDLFLPNRPRTGLATTYSTGYNSTGSPFWFWFTKVVDYSNSEKWKCTE